MEVPPNREDDEDVPPRVEVGAGLVAPNPKAEGAGALVVLELAKLNPDDGAGVEDVVGAEPPPNEKPVDDGAAAGVEVAGAPNENPPPAGP